MKFLMWLLILLSGMAILRYRYQIYDFTGEWGWAEKYLGGNGTISAISLIWALLIGIGTAYPFWVIDFSPDPRDTLPGFTPR
jgi:hypothetical protein